jgi:hypothetical protein
VPFFKKSGLRNYWLIILFITKIAAGCAYGWFYSLPANVQTSDTWNYFEYSKTETDWLLKDPVAFVKDLFTYNHDSTGNLFIAKNSYWNQLKSNIIIKILAIVNVFTFKNYYANVIFFNFFFFFGCIAFYRLLTEKITANILVRIAFVFCIPSFLFWCSGLHKDGFIFMAVALCAFYFNEWMKRKRIFFEGIFIFIVCLFVLFSMRNFIVFLLLPALLTWYLCNRYPKRQMALTASIYAVAIILFFVVGLINNAVDFPAYIINKQNEFKALGGNSQLALPKLGPDLLSFIRFLPNAIDIVFLRPHVSEATSIIYWPYIVENIFIYALIGCSVVKLYVKRKKELFSSSTKAFLIFCFVFAVSNFLLMGYTVTLTGAIVRYKAFVLPFVIAPLSYFVKIDKNQPLPG